MVTQERERDYELMVVLDPNLDEAAVEAQTGRVSSLVTSRGGTVQSNEAWGGGRRRLAYPIGRHRDGVYFLMRLTVDSQATTEIERALELSEGVVRHLLVRPVEGTSPPPPPAPPVHRSGDTATVAPSAPAPETTAAAAPSAVTSGPTAPVAEPVIEASAGADAIIAPAEASAPDPDGR